MDRLIHTFLLLILVLASIGIMIWFEKNFILPQKSKMAERLRRAMKPRYRARRLCQEHILVLKVPGSMAILDNDNCHLCREFR